jgi:hypothetical protein
MPDKVPLGLFGDKRNLFHGFLYFVFAENTNASLDRSGNLFVGTSFGHSHQRDIGRRPPGAVSRLGNLRADSLNRLRYLARHAFSGLRPQQSALLQEIIRPTMRSFARWTTRNQTVQCKGERTLRQ